MCAPSFLRYLILTDPSTQDLPTLLKEYESHAGLAVSWTMFSTSGHLTKPTGGTLESYWQCHTSILVKCIVNTQFVIGPLKQSHMLLYKNGTCAVGEDFVPVNGGNQECSRKRLVLNHYVLRSRAEFYAKSVRGSGAGNHKGVVFFKGTKAAAKYNCTDAVELMRGRAWRRDLPSIEWSRFPAPPGPPVPPIAPKPPKPPSRPLSPPAPPYICPPVPRGYTFHANLGHLGDDISCLRDADGATWTVDQRAAACDAIARCYSFTVERTGSCLKVVSGNLAKQSRLNSFLPMSKTCRGIYIKTDGR